MLETFLRRIMSENGGFMRDDDIAELAKLDRLRQVLVRCGNGRFVTAADSVAHFVGIIEREHGDDFETGSDYVRDVSLLASDPCYRGDYRPVTVPPRLQGNRIPPERLDKMLKAAHARADASPYVTNFREEDCGGAFDGFGVISDADPGL